MGPYALNSTIEKVDTSEAPLVEPTGSLHDLLSFLKKFDVAKKKSRRWEHQSLGASSQRSWLFQSAFSRESPSLSLSPQDFLADLCVHKGLIVEILRLLYIVAICWFQTSIDMQHYPYGKVFKPRLCAPFENVLSLRQVTKVLSDISKIHANNFTPLQESMSSYLKRVDTFNVVQSSNFT